MYIVNYTFVNFLENCNHTRVIQSNLDCKMMVINYLSIYLSKFEFWRWKN